MRLPTDRTNTQNAWVVTDIEAAILDWHKTMGIGPFFLGTYPVSLFPGMQYRGNPGELTMKTAIAYSGDLQIELIEPLGDAPNAYRDVFPKGTAGFHHMCFWTDDIDQDLAHYAANDCPAVNVGQMRGGPRFAYVDTRQKIGCMTELLERHEHVEHMFADWKKQSAQWDGQSVIVRL